MDRKSLFSRLNANVIGLLNSFSENCVGDGDLRLVLADELEAQGFIDEAFVQPTLHERGKIPYSQRGPVSMTYSWFSSWMIQNCYCLPIENGSEYPTSPIFNVYFDRFMIEFNTLVYYRRQFVPVVRQS